MAKYNPYNSYQNVLNHKADWHTAKQLGQDPSQYALNATRDYRDLVDNGYETLADELYRSDYITAKGLADKYGLKPDEDLEIDNFMNQATGNGAKRSVYSGIDYTANDSSIDNLLDQIQNGSDMMNGSYQTAQGLATGAIQTQPSATTQGAFNAYNDQNNRLNGEIRYDDQGNVVSGLNTAHYNIGREQLDRINNFDVTKQPYYQGIMDQYKLGGYNAAQGAYANGAANNGGNIDSYAAANANRQQLAFTTAGQQAALAAAQQNANNWQNLYSQMSQDLNNQGNISLKTLEQARMMYQTDADERMNALDAAGYIAKADMDAKIRAYEQAVKERMEDKRITSDEAMQEADLAEQKARLEMEIARDIEQSNIEADWRKYMSDNDLTGTMYTADRGVDEAGIRANADMYSADRNAEATLGAAGINANSALERARMDYDLGMAGFQNALDVVRAQTEANTAQTEASKRYEQEYLQMLLDNGLLPQGVTMQNPGTVGTLGGSTVSDEEAYSPEVTATVMTNAILNNNLEDINLTGLNNVKSVDDLNRLLMDDKSGYGYTTKQVNEFYKNLGYVGMDADGFLQRLNTLIPGITEEFKRRTNYLPTISQQ